MNSRTRETNLWKRRLTYVVLVGVLLIGGSSFGWNFLAGRLDQQISAQITRLAQQGKTFACDNRQVRGFPFRIGLFCDQIKYEDKSGDILFEAGQLRSAAQFYQPGFIVGELDGPVTINNQKNEEITLNWKLARSSSKINLDGLKLLSIQIDEIDAKGSNGYLNDQSIAAFEKLTLHVRPAGDNINSPDIEAALESQGMRFGNILEKNGYGLDLNLDGIVFDLNQSIKQGKDFGAWVKRNGLKLRINKLEIAIESGGKLVASGPLQVDKEGYVDGNLEVAVSEIHTIVENFTAQNPQLGETAKTIEAASRLFAQSAKDGKIKMKIQITRGTMMMGFIPLGFIPQLF